MEHTMHSPPAPTIVALAFCSGAALAQDVSYTNDIGPLFKANCAECHGADAPIYKEFKKQEEKFSKEKIGPRMDSYPLLISHVAWPETGALMRRLDDGTATGGKPGNMYQHLGSDEQERQKNLALFKAWVGEGGWNLNRWKARGNVPAITKAQLDNLKLKY